ncbi:type II toxin-antitoxin system RelE/ParE family toxin [Brachybacterium sp. UMB0905]|uniref:type II toxin-antitoxin system RelE family toxin n=1 Tax=Brachybacterium sp. UMB0905 TaxID=2069310 RepID=UPI000C801614|nr:type II toxin-antitoxin system RelE/ParE family toxin [Brachybacterium sp. UMB0905]PMC74958.1 hypothetical protein CJ197_10745 [Brachybacterium sp. UMB0905]
MSWAVRYAPRAAKALRKLDKPVARRVTDAMHRLAEREDPASACKALSGPLVGMWRLRVGDYRVIMDIRRSELIIIALDVGHRSTAYDD